ncbi:MAG: cation:proton antiporter [Methanoregula sp.]|uniref:cation:proton antiporter domain-containing protein n=1 Tax=Methanoregula sp. TaxID=2052170 RepID=UPI0025F46788|nr:cation:proton antiporter [Methanoregula sp.]MCK9632008.1 cation:proton antiporter [Methanoregula sp.]
MDAAVTVLFLGLLIFIGNILSRFFTLTKIPDVLFLIAIGIIIGPFLDLVEPSAFGVVGPLFTMVTLAIILFEGGLNITVEHLKKAITGTTAITAANFVAIIGICIVVMHFFAGFTIMESCMLGAILGGTAAAVVIPFTNYLNIRHDTKAILALESAIGDVLCIVILLALLNIVELKEFNAGLIVGSLISSFLIAIIIGILAGIWWSSIYHKIASIKSIFLTPAFVFIVFGFVNLLGFSGAIAALALGLTLGNLHYFKAEKFLPFLGDEVTQVELTPIEKTFFTQLVSLLKTFFFIYIGISIHFTNMEIIYIGAILTALFYLVRIVIVWFTIPRSIPASDAAIVAVMDPKGLAAAVLASMPLEVGIAAGQSIQDITYIVIFFTTLVCSVMVFLLERTAFAGVYRKLFWMFGKETPPS